MANLVLERDRPVASGVSAMAGVALADSEMDFVLFQPVIPVMTESIPHPRFTELLFDRRAAADSAETSDVRREPGLVALTKSVFRLHLIGTGVDACSRRAGAVMWLPGFLIVEEADPPDEPRRLSVLSPLSLSSSKFAIPFTADTRLTTDLRIYAWSDAGLVSYWRVVDLPRGSGSCPRSSSDSFVEDPDSDSDQETSVSLLKASNIGDDIPELIGADSRWAPMPSRRASESMRSAALADEVTEVPPALSSAASCGGSSEPPTAGTASGGVAVRERSAAAPRPAADPKGGRGGTRFCGGGGGFLARTRTESRGVGSASAVNVSEAGGTRKLWLDFVELQLPALDRPQRAAARPHASCLVHG